LRRTSIKKERN